MDNKKKKKNRVTISEAKYKELLRIKERLSEILGSEEGEDRRRKDKEKKAFKKAFGVLEDDFEGKSSLEYVKSLRKKWRS